MKALQLTKDIFESGKISAFCFHLGALTDLFPVLSHGQTVSQVIASTYKLNLRRDLRWVAKRSCKFPYKYMYTQVSKKQNILR